MRATGWIVGIALTGALSAGIAFAQQRAATETEALSYISSAFITQADPGVISRRVSLGPELQKRLGLAPDTDSAKVYQALIALTGDKKVDVRKATPKEVAEYGARRGFDPGSPHPLYTVEAGDVRLLLQYDLRAVNVPFVGQLGIPDPDPKPVAKAQPAAVAASVAKSQPEPQKPAPLSLAWTGQFEFNRWTLTPEAQARLDGEIIPKLSEVAQIRIHVNGHSDRIGSAEYNQRLSEKRAEAVRAYLVSRGVDPENIEVFSYGKTLPVKSCREEKSRSALRDCLAPNRRVVMEIQATQ